MAGPHQHREFRRSHRGLDWVEKQPSTHNGSGEKLIASSKRIEEVSGRICDGAGGSFVASNSCNGSSSWVDDAPTSSALVFQSASSKQYQRRKSAYDKRKQQVKWQHGPEPQNSRARDAGKGTIPVSNTSIFPRHVVSSPVDQGRRRTKGNAAESDAVVGRAETVLEKIGQLFLIPDSEVELNKQEQADEVCTTVSYSG